LIYLLDDDASKDTLHIKGEKFKYLIKVLRHSVGDMLDFRNKDDIETLHRYKIVDIEPRSVVLSLISSQKSSVVASKKLHIVWCVIDTKSIEKMLPSLNEIGVSDISFVYCDRSQKNFKLDFKRFDRILEASSQQCGRTSKINFDTYKNLDEVLKKFPDIKVFDFTKKVLDETCDFEVVLIGCEGGFSKDEKEMLQSQEVFRLNTPMVLRSESAVFAVAAKILL